MAELQTIAAAAELCGLAAKLCRLIKRAKDAGDIAKDAHERIEKLGEVLMGVEEAFEDDEHMLPPQQNVRRRIDESIAACRKVLEDVDKKFCGSGSAEQGQRVGLGARFKIAFSEDTLPRLQRDVQTHMNALQLNLSILHTYKLNALSGQNQAVLEQLGKLSVQRTTFQDSEQSQTGRTVSATDDEVQAAARRVMAESIAEAEEIVDRLTSEYLPDPQSDIQHSQLGCDSMLSPRDSPLMTPAAGAAQEGDVMGLSLSALSLSSLRAPLDEEVAPLSILDQYITSYYSRFESDLERAKLSQAEAALSEAMSYSELRERKYGQPFTARVQYQEELAEVHQRQQKYSEAIREIQELIREGENGVDVSTKIAQARQHQLLGLVYFNRHQKPADSPRLSDRADLERASKHALTALKKRDQLLKAEETPEVAENEASRQRQCHQLLVDIFSARGMVIEAQVHKKILQDSPNQCPESLRRPSEATSRPPTDYVVVENWLDLCQQAIRANDQDQMPGIVALDEFSVEPLEEVEKTTLLFNAVNRGDSTAMHKLLDPADGANVNAQGRHGDTALHVAASRGSYEMVSVLLHYRALVNLRDRSGETALLKAVKGGHLETIKALVRLDTAVDFGLLYEDDLTVLHFAVDTASTAMTALLLDLAPQLADSVERRGLTALHHCAEQGYIEQAETLLSHRHPVDVNAVDRANRTALHMAFVGPRVTRDRMAEMLIRHHAQIDKGRPHPRFKESLALRRTDTRTSVSTQGSTGTASSVTSRHSSVFSRLSLGRRTS
ncbi:hypothetical protein KC340_g5641 [Hortaea werneckii]|nr:hypothetical protein KC342_g5909 [Hortaea werneckii]KAI7099876.1 hypothetical protein KC339_g7891 [Hortaea werneckii]KAI7242327.1 hypothetical protein KC365_g3260 [Hortaea werneckii]KAI7327268.1 hypothetical protein KC340_g5641 [Hortaea werneckii]KAI7403731.1 hypothetical protein KC328_g2200 [Hortaea werneckii]